MSNYKKSRAVLVTFPTFFLLEVEYMSVAEPDKGPLGIFQIDPEYENYHLSEKNQEILQSFMMSNGVDTNDRNEAKNLLLKRDNSAIFILNEDNLWYIVIYLPLRFLSSQDNWYLTTVIE